MVTPKIIRSRRDELQWQNARLYHVNRHRLLRGGPDLFIGGNARNASLNVADREGINCGRLHSVDRPPLEAFEVIGLREWSCDAVRLF